MRLSLSIQHHPSRPELLQRLVAALTPAKVQVIRDPEPEATPSSWRSYGLALEMTPAWATHRIVIQDDSILCPDFLRTLDIAVQGRPDHLLALCVCGRPTRIAQMMLAAYDRGDTWLELNPWQMQWVPTIALVWPRRLIAPTLGWVAGQDWPRGFMADDEIVMRAMRSLKEDTILASVPSLVQHDERAPSLFRERPPGDPGRSAALFGVPHRFS